MLVHGEKFSEEALIRLLKDCHIKYPHIVLAQAKLESGDFKSKMFRQNFNMFGMKLPRQRITTALGEKSGHAYYRDWIDCVHDYGMYQSAMMCNVNNEVEYFTKLDERYAEDTTYISKLKHIIEVQKLKDIFLD
jgi:flagellum-specific peptidoglycan hydrolase FlgJ